jgi:hypothetical protein
MSTKPVGDRLRFHSSVDRREFLWRLGGGLGGVALTHLLQGGQPNAASNGAEVLPDLNGGIHHPAKVRRVIQLFMNGGASQMDTFDYKPELIRRDGQEFDPGTHVEAATSTPGKLMKSPFEWQQHGQCGRWVSSVFPRLAGQVDDIAFLMAVASKTNVHGPASFMMNTGFLTPGFPCLGAWVSYGLGRLSDNLPTFVVLPDSNGLPYNQKSNFSSGFLPVVHQGTLINAAAREPVADLFPPPSEHRITAASERDGLELLGRLNRDHLKRFPGDSRLEARIDSYEMAAKLQLSAPEVLDVAGESDSIRKLYGLEDETTREFGRRCLLARRMIERGVRFVQVWSGAGGPKNNWDNHTDIVTELPKMTNATDGPVAALLIDLKQRGLLEDTLVVWSTEFGRMPFTQGATGRDHNGGTSVSWMAGAGVRGGVAYGQSDEWAWKAASNQTYCYDVHATLLHLLGIDHEQLTFRYNGSNRRLTDVHGHVIHEILS